MHINTAPLYFRFPQIKSSPLNLTPQIANFTSPIRSSFYGGNVPCGITSFRSTVWNFGQGLEIHFVKSIETSRYNSE